MEGVVKYDETGGRFLAVGVSQAVAGLHPVLSHGHREDGELLLELEGLVAAKV